jgi:hypothetical protein
VHAALKTLEVGAAVLVEGDDLAVEDDLRLAKLGRERANLGVLRGDVTAVSALELQMPGVAVADGPHPVPLELVRPPALVGRQAAERRGHRGDVLGHGHPPGVRGRVHAVDHPVLPLGREEAVGALDALAVQDDCDLLVVPLEGLVGAVVPDRHLPGPVLALRDLAVELEVLERVVLGVDREAVLLGVGRQALGKGPGDGHALALQPQVPVKAPGVVLLNDEAPALALRRGLLPARLGRLFEGALALVLVESLLGHCGPSLGAACVPPEVRRYFALQWHKPCEPRGAQDG